mgnify:CR=1 FL=1
MEPAMPGLIERYREYLPIAEGDTLSLVERDTPSESIEVELTADDTGVASLWLVGV